MPSPFRFALASRLGRSRLAAPTLALVIGACASRATPATPASAPTPAAPGASQPAPGALAMYAGHPLAVFPLQHVQHATADSALSVDSVERRFDDAFATGARARGIAAGWAMAAELERSARRNPGFVADPRTLTTGGIAARHTDEAISAALAGEIRATVALHDARFAIVPYLLRVVADSAGRGATLSLVVVDARLARVVARTEVVARGATALDAAVAAADRVADLFVAP